MKICARGGPSNTTTTRPVFAATGGFTTGFSGVFVTGLSGVFVTGFSGGVSTGLSGGVSAVCSTVCSVVCSVAEPVALPVALPTPALVSTGGAGVGVGGVGVCVWSLVATCGGESFLLVAITTLVTSNIVSTETVRDLGVRLASSLAHAAVIKSQEQFDRSVSHLKAFAGAFRKPGITLPSDNPNMDPEEVFCPLLRAITQMTNFAYPSLGMIAEDGGEAQVGCHPGQLAQQVAHVGLLAGAVAAEDVGVEDDHAASSV